MSLTTTYLRGYTDNTMRKKPFGQILKSHREKANLSIRDLADKADLMFTAIYKLESGKNQPNWETIQKLAKALDLPFDAFKTL